MTELELVAAYASVAVFATSGIAKILSPGAIEPLLRDLHLSRVTRLISYAVGSAEVVVAVGMAARFSPYVFVAAGGLLALFTAVLLFAIIRGSTAACGCLGDLGEAPVGMSHVVRNGVLAFAVAVGGFAARADTVAAIPAALALAALIVLAPEFVTLVRDLHRQAEQEVARSRLGA